MWIASVLAWPSDTGVAGGAIAAVVLGVPGYLHTHKLARRRHADRLAQAERHHLEREASATAHHNALAQHLTATLRLPARAPRKPASGS